MFYICVACCINRGSTPRTEEDIILSEADLGHYGYFAALSVGHGLSRPGAKEGPESGNCDVKRAIKRSETGRPRAAVLKCVPQYFLC